MLKIAAFADEISPDLDEQIRVCRANGVTHIELRSVNKINVLDLDKPLRQEIERKLNDSGMAICGIGSPIGKVKINDSWETHFDRFKIAVELAQFFAAPMVRIFSYYPPEGGDIQKHRDEVMRRMRAKVEFIRTIDVTLVHENEARIYGESGRGCEDLMKTIDSPKLRSAFDFGNFVLAGERPIDNWPALKPYTTHFHIKDASVGTTPASPGKILPAGQGTGDIGAILADAFTSGYRGFVTLEPHLSSGGQFGGHTGVELFKVAADALKDVCRRHGVPLVT